MLFQEFMDALRLQVNKNSTKKIFLKMKSSNLRCEKIGKCGEKFTSTTK